MTEPALAGLLTKGKPIPLEGVTIDAEIRDFCSRVTVTQRYRNQEEKPIEAVYVFPLDERAAVCAFAAVVDGVEILGEVKEREEAFDRYDDALAEGHGAYLLDLERPDVFTARIGNLLPGKEALVRITYVAELGLEGDDLRFMLPTTVSPRYAPAEDRKGVGRSPAEAVNPPVAWEVPYGLELTVRLEMPSSIRGLESKVLRQLSRALAPAVTDVRVSWGGIDVRQAPHRVPAVFASGRVLVYGFLERPLEREVEVKLEARSSERALSFSVPLSPAKRRTGSLVATLAARAHLRDLEEGGEKERATEIGVQYGLSSKWTSFLAIERRPDAAPREIELRRIPVALTRGWGGIDGGAGFRSSPGDTGAFARLSVSITAASAAAPVARVAPRPLDRLVVLQRADGSWDLDDELAAVLGVRLRKLRKKLEGATGDPDEAARAWATALALAWLESHASESRDEWELLADKAKAWLSRCGAKLAGGEVWLAAAAPALTARRFWQ